ncbi:MAG: hypothetical protein ACR2QC_07780 [Gammaproteobacteria bacterium]
MGTKRLVGKRNDISLLRQYAKLMAAKARKEDSLELTKANIEAVELRVLDYLQRQGIKAIKIHTGNGQYRNVQVRRDLWPKKLADDTGVQLKALELAGLKDNGQVSVNVQSLRGVINEAVLDYHNNSDDADAASKTPEEILWTRYPALKGIIGISEEFTVRAPKV